MATQPTSTQYTPRVEEFPLRQVTAVSEPTRAVEFEIRTDDGRVSFWLPVPRYLDLIVGLESDPWEGFTEERIPFVLVEQPDSSVPKLLAAYAEGKLITCHQTRQDAVTNQPGVAA